MSNPIASDFRSPAWVVASGRWIDRLGVGLSVLGLVALTLVGALFASWSMMSAYPPEWLLRSLAITAVVSTGIATPVSYVLCRLLTDVSRSRAALRQIAHVDALTGAQSRRHFMDTAPGLLADAERTTLVLLDIDNFKQINDRYGHPAGDAVLRAVSCAARQVLRSDDLFARYGGEEFVALLPGAGGGDSARIVERMRLAIADLRLSVGGEPLRVTASFGVAIRPRTADGDQTLREAVVAADTALYEAKRGGKDRVCFEGGVVPVDAPAAFALAADQARAPLRADTHLDPDRRDRRRRPQRRREMPANFQSPRWVVVLGDYVERSGRVKAALVSVAISTVAATALTVAVMMLAGLQQLGVGVRFSCTLTPVFSALISWLLCSLVADVSRARTILRRVAHVDALTEAHSRRYFMDAAPDLLARTPSCVVVLLDVDNFKSINDRFGHSVGDQVLKAVSDASRSALRSGDLFARYGGEEFAAVLPGIDASAARSIVERMRLAVAELALTAPDGEPVVVTASFGMAHPGAFAERSAQAVLEAALGAADRALYRAKRGGRNRVDVDPGVDVQPGRLSLAGAVPV